MKRSFKYFLLGFVGCSFPMCFLSFIAVTLGKTICFLGGNVCFVRPEWLAKLFGSY